MRAKSLTGLYWSIRGSVLCRAHIAEIDDDRLEGDGWAPLPDSSQGFHGRRYQCQRCAPDVRAVANGNGHVLPRSA